LLPSVKPHASSVELDSKSHPNKYSA